MKKLLDRLRGEQPVVISAQSVEAARVFYEAEGMNRIEARIVLPQGEVMILELTPDQVYKLVMELAACYRAIRPHIRF